MYLIIKVCLYYAACVTFFSMALGLGYLLNYKMYRERQPRHKEEIIELLNKHIIIILSFIQII